MESVRIQHVNFRYPTQGRQVLQDVSFSVPAGEFVVLCGPSGCGKTTLLRQLKTVLAPHGEKTGEILLEGKPLEQWDQRQQSAKIGFVLQNPENQIVTDKVWHELAFGLESLGFATPVIRLRVAEMASFFGIEDWFYKNVAELSGGQKQLLNLASIMAMQPSLLILDEPTSQLDPIAASEFLETVGRINRELGVTVLMTEHRLGEVFPLADRVIVMERGRVVANGSPRQVGEQLRQQQSAMFLAMPAPMQIYASVPNQLPCPITVRDGRQWLAAYTEQHSLLPVAPPPPQSAGPVLLEMKDVWFRYERTSPDVIKGLSLTIRQGEFLAVLGGNGTGKSTTLSLLAGLRQPYRGQILLEGVPLATLAKEQRSQGALGMLPQNPQSLFVKKTVQEDLYEVLRGRGIDQEEQQRRVERVVALCHLQPLLQQHPYDLSGGEQQRAALAKVLLLQPRILLLDEPTKGLDAEFKQEFAGILYRLLQQGATILMVSHDVEFCARYAQRCALFFDGNLAASGPPHTFFSGNSFYTTAANRMARQWLPQAVTAEDVIFACGGTPPQGDWQGRLEPVTDQPEPFTGVTDQPEQQNGNFLQEEPLAATEGGLAQKKHIDVLPLNQVMPPPALPGDAVAARKELADLPLAAVASQKTSGTAPAPGTAPWEQQARLSQEQTLLDNDNATLAEVWSAPQRTQIEGTEVGAVPQEQRTAFARAQALGANKGPMPAGGDTMPPEGVFLPPLGKKKKRELSNKRFSIALAALVALFFGVRGLPDLRSFASTSGDLTKMLAESPGDLWRYTLTILLLAGGVVALVSALFVYPDEKPLIQVAREQRKLSKRTLFATVIALLLIPLTIFVGYYYFGDRKYYFISLLIVIETILPFALVFEGRKPQARELIVIAVLCALGVAGRAAFFMIPQFKPVVAIVIIAGVAFGGEAGFLVGAIVGLVSNMFLGQGPWTPWQMFSFGIIGFLAGVLFRKGLLCRNRLPLAIFGGIATFCIYGGIMNPCALLMAQANPTPAMFFLYYLRGIPFDLIHAAATVCFLWLFSQPMLEKLDRIKVKYGLLET